MEQGNTESDGYGYGNGCGCGNGYDHVIGLDDLWKDSSPLI